MPNVVIEQVNNADFGEFLFDSWQMPIQPASPDLQDQTDIAVAYFLFDGVQLRVGKGPERAGWWV